MTKPDTALMWGVLTALSRLRDWHPDITALQAQMFLLVACRPGISQREVWDELGTSATSASRTLAVLSNLGSRGMVGLDVIRIEVDESDRRNRLLYLTQKGERLVRDLISDIETGKVPPRLSEKTNA